MLRNQRFAAPFFAVFAAGMIALAALAPSTPVEITSISANGTNLVLNATVPAGMQNVRLEIKPTLNGEWTQQGVLDVQANEGPVAFAISKPDVETAFFRLVATPSATAGVPPAPSTSAQKVTAQSASVVSPELGYVTIPPVASASATDGVLYVKATIDGSDRMLVTREGIFWNHINWDWPHGAVSVNGVQWKPQQKDYVTTRGNALLIPATLSPQNATLEKIKGRDVVVLERMGTDALIVYVNDTWLGAGDYEFKIHFHPAAPATQPAASTAAKLKITGQFDGSDSFKISATGATLRHTSMKFPTGLRFNEVPWTPGTNNLVLKNEGTNSFLPSGIDFSTAKITRRKGRDLVTLWAEKDDVLVQFADNPLGSDHYELEISFGQ